MGEWIGKGRGIERGVSHVTKVPIEKFDAEFVAIHAVTSLFCLTLSFSPFSFLSFSLPLQELWHRDPDVLVKDVHTDRSTLDCHRRTGGSGNFLQITVSLPGELLEVQQSQFSK